MTSFPEDSNHYENPPYAIPEGLIEPKQQQQTADLSRVAIDGKLLDDVLSNGIEQREANGISIAQFNHIADSYAVAQKAQYEPMVPQPGRASWWTLSETYEIGDGEIGFAGGFSPRSIRKNSLRYRNKIVYRVGEDSTNSLLAADFAIRTRNDSTVDLISLGFESGDSLNCIRTTLHGNDIYQAKPKSRLSIQREASDAKNTPSKIDDITARIERETGLNLAGRNWLEIGFGDEPEICFFNSYGGLQGVPSSMERAEAITFIYDEKTRSFRYERDDGPVLIGLEEAALVVRELLDILSVPLKNATDLR